MAPPFDRRFNLNVFEIVSSVKELLVDSNGSDYWELLKPLIIKEFNHLKEKNHNGLIETFKSNLKPLLCHKLQLELVDIFPEAQLKNNLYDAIINQNIEGVSELLEMIDNIHEVNNCCLNEVIVKKEDIVDEESLITVDLMINTLEKMDLLKKYKDSGEMDQILKMFNKIAKKYGSLKLMRLITGDLCLNINEFKKAMNIPTPAIQAHKHNFVLSPSKKRLFYVACEMGNLEIIELLLSKGLHADEFTNNGSSPLSVLIQNGNFETAKILIEKQANLQDTFIFESMYSLNYENIKNCILKLNVDNFLVKHYQNFPISLFLIAFDHLTATKAMFETNFFDPLESFPCPRSTERQTYIERVNEFGTEEMVQLFLKHVTFEKIDCDRVDWRNWLLSKDEHEKYDVDSDFALTSDSDLDLSDLESGDSSSGFSDDIAKEDDFDIMQYCCEEDFGDEINEQIDRFFKEKRAH
eukprot:TRINITY_DN6908_c0_g1_i1.p1 TRINITY_DN6908_c0_g1~~TRINITY_DN6908_c0_g1_i1.p1  ORF type:complete len:515 (+),score=149.71 TRINITY_DN6908_c0_g1_i1:145-1545(+)